jgi:dipeptidyl aminopeptidase/acylaminoacyl peptidase
LTPDDPPTLVLHGTIDQIVPVRQSDALVDKLKELGVPYRYERLEGWPHAMDLAELVNRHCRSSMVEFFEEHIPLPK